MKGKPAQVAAEAQVTKLLVSGNPFMPLPKLYQSKKNIWMSFSWGSTGTSISGPYFSSESLPQWLLETVGLSVPTTRTRVRARAASTDYRDSSEAFAVYATTFISQGSEIGAEQMEM